MNRCNPDVDHSLQCTKDDNPGVAEGLLGRLMERKQDEGGVDIENQVMNRSYRRHESLEEPGGVENVGVHICCGVDVAHAHARVLILCIRIAFVPSGRMITLA